MGEPGPVRSPEETNESLLARAPDQLHHLQPLLPKNKISSICAHGPQSTFTRTSTYAGEDYTSAS